MPRTPTPLTAVRQVLLLRAAALGITPETLASRVQYMGMERACTTPRHGGRGEATMAHAIAAYYQHHPDEVPPWGREEVAHDQP